MLLPGRRRYTKLTLRQTASQFIVYSRRLAKIQIAFGVSNQLVAPGLSSACDLRKQREEDMRTYCLIEI
jgi:hypothetical protein